MSENLLTLSQREDSAQVLGQLSGLVVYPRSVALAGDSLFFLGRAASGRGSGGRRLGVLQPARDAGAFQLAWQPVTWEGADLSLGLGATDHPNALALRARLPFTAPRALGIKKSAGLGDRLGIATPGHIRALRQVTRIAPILAQQSMREMQRAGRTPADVLDDATWGVLQEGWRERWGADADHLKTEADIDACAAAGYVQFTLDPRDDVDNAPETDSLTVLEFKYAALPWAQLETTPADTRRAFLGHAWVLGEGFCLTLTKEQLLRAACKYGPAVARLTRLYRYLQKVMGPRSFDVEISVDETDTPTTPAEHLYIAGELKRLGVTWVSLAPRYVGRFEKGVDYIGDLAAFEADFAWHAALARALGPYKLSLHSGSDKFRIYPSVARLAGDLVHLKTAGTSYLEALRAVARIDPPLLRDIMRFAVGHYEQDRASYYVSAQLSRIPAPDTLSDTVLDGALDLFDVRQLLHVTFGTVLTAADAQGRPLFRERLFAALEGDEEAHYAALEAHITRHLLPFSG